MLPVLNLSLNLSKLNHSERLFCSVSLNTGSSGLSSYMKLIESGQSISNGKKQLW